ncbi:MAG: Gfo/Idh/MocA family oxidoreductase [Gaiellaceae bacterium]
MRVGVLGCGAIATAVHLRTLRRTAGVRVVAVADPSAQALERARGLAPETVILSEPEELLERDDLSAVVIATPSPTHARLALAAIERGLHLYLEKPLATTLADAERVATAARRRRDLVFAVGFNRRFHPLYRQARSILAGGVLGDLRAAAATLCEPVSGGWRLDPGSGGALIDLASHHVDLLHWLGASRAASAEILAPRPERAFLQLRFESGMLGSVLAAFDSGRSDSLVLHGRKGWLRVDRYTRRLELALDRPRSFSVKRRRIVPSRTVVSWRLRSLVRPSSDPSYAAALRAWLAVVQGGAAELPGCEDGLRCLEALARPAPIGRAARLGE